MTQRVLDNEPWYPHHRDDTGNIVVVRGVPQPDDFDPSAEYSGGFSKQAFKPEPSLKKVDAELDSSPNEDQPAASRPQTETSLTTTYTRDPAVAREAKMRAADGKCECCGKQGFETAQGGYYLEAHHVIPRNCGGPDELWNVAAIYADDHKRAHFGIDRAAVRDQLIQILGSHYPARLAVLLECAKKMDINAASGDRLEESTET